MKKQFVFQLTFVLISVIALSQNNTKAKYITAWGVIGKNIEPRTELMAGKDIYLQISDERTLTHKNWERIALEFEKTLAATYPDANFHLVSASESANIEQAKTTVIKVEIPDCQTYLSKGKWFTKTTFDITLWHGGETDERVFSYDIEKGNMWGNTTAMIIHEKAYKIAMDGLLTYLDEIFSE
ncbi:MAG: hypothetical protein R2830_26680 [Saprospiraceae bacterium]